MWGFGGRYYWGRRERNEKIEGIVVVFAWMSSQDKHLKNYIQLYSSLGWNSLICHSQFLNMFFPDKAADLAFGIVSEIVKELKKKPCPVVFSSFSGGPKACMCKVLQIIEGKCDLQLNEDDCELVRKSISSFIYDSSPVDFTSDLGARFVVHPTVLKMSHPPRFVSWLANGIASGLDALFLTRFESQRAEYWQTLYSSVRFGGPFLILCSENDDLAPYQVIKNFADRLRQLGADVKLVKWNGSPHVGHFKHYPVDYQAAVTEVLGKAAATYSQRFTKPEGDKVGSSDRTHDEVSEAICKIRKAAWDTNQGFWGVTLAPADQFLSSGAGEFSGESVQGAYKEDLIHLPGQPTISAHGVLGQILFDICVPKNVEDWDVGLSNGQRSKFMRRHAPFNPIKCIRRSRL